MREYKIIEDDIDLVIERIQDCAAKEFEEAKNQRGRIHNELADMR
jgi:hypothetical protein